ncbi:MAG: hypothetical protein J5483_04820, partial [Lachnospiraceae bacterium]|nr:hypothetical protein [Lachnospiraceae bacterium]
MKQMIRKITLILSALILAGSLFFQLNLPVYAEEEPPITEETSIEEITGAEHSSFGSEMLTAAKDRYGFNKRSLLRNADPDAPSHSNRILEYASTPYIGNAYIVAFHVDFPDQQFEEGDTEEALQKAIGVDLAGNQYASFYNDQYDNVNGYYQRASYGKLFISGDTFSYTAQKSRDDYADSTELFKEVLAAANDTVDYSQYDADEDGRIDCIYLHIPYDPDDQWGTTWWPNCSTLQDENLWYDNVLAASRVIISRKLNGGDGVRTLIHETGHSMGFPDYYSFNTDPDPIGGSNRLSGILTFDMMDSNAGDHNGFSKWLAGWLDESDVTRVIANENGVVATRDGVPVGTVNEDGSVTLDLASFDSDTLDETGGIIIVGNDDKAPFSRYFLIQYDSFAGNQKVYYGNDKPLPSGFRVFRVQADLNEYGQLKHSNTTDPLYDKLIELVDPDYKADHTVASTLYVPNGFGQDSYTCMFYGGSSLTPTSAPSTNFRDNIDVGFTGISIEFLESGEKSGTLKISYSDKEKPVEKPLEIELTEGTAFPGAFNVTLKGNRDLVFGIFGAQGISAAIMDGEEFIMSDPMTEYTLDGDTIHATFHFDTDHLINGRTVLIRVRAGAFDTGNDDEWSERFEFEVPITPLLADLSESGLVEDTIAQNMGHVLSPIQRAEDGSYYFYGFAGIFLPMSTTDVYKYTFTEEDPANVTQVLLEPGSDERSAAVKYLSNVYYEQQTEGVASVPENAELGEFQKILDAVKIDDYYYTVSFREYNDSFGEPNRMAISKLDANGKLIDQIIPAGNEIQQEPETSSRVRILTGPNGTIAVLLFRPFQDRGTYLSGHMATFFLDQDLNIKSRLDNYSTGCGTWLEDGRFITFGQRTKITMDEMDAGIMRLDMICYDITTAIDSAVYKGETADGSMTAKWTSGSEDGLLLIFHRDPADETTLEHFL